MNIVNRKKALFVLAVMLVDGYVWCFWWLLLLPAIDALSVVSSPFLFQSQLRTNNPRHFCNKKRFVTRRTALILWHGNSDSINVHEWKGRCCQRRQSSRTIMVLPLAVRSAVLRFLEWLLHSSVTSIRHYYKSRSCKASSWRQFNDSRKSFRSKLCSLFVFMMIAWNSFFAISPANSIFSRETHHPSLQQPLMAVLADETRVNARPFIPLGLANSDLLVAGHTIQVEKERKISWQQRQDKNFCWDVIPEDDIFGLSYQTGPCFVLYRKRRQLKEVYN